MERGKATNNVKCATTTLCIMALSITLAAHCYVANASLLQDFCVGINSPDSEVTTNGKLCKNPKEVTIRDFLYKGFHKPGDTNNTQQAKATLIDVNRFPAVNTLGVSIARVDFAPFGLNTPHFHPHGSEIFTVTEGALYAGFVTTENKLYDTVLKKGDIIVFPQGLIHFQLNVGDKNAVAIAAFGSQNPGRVNIANGVFGTTPSIMDDVLTKALQVDDKVIEKLRAQFSSEKVTSNASKSVLRLLSHQHSDVE